MHMKIGLTFPRRENALGRTPLHSELADAEMRGG
jgi:hypothetical protein